MRLEIYTDGAAINNGFEGSIGYSAVLFSSGQTQEAFGSEPCEKASSNRAELLAMRLGLETAQASGWSVSELILSSDSEWAVKSVRGEYRANSHPELIGEVRARLRTFSKAEILWVRGHCGHQLQERAHTLANSAARREEKKRCQVAPSGLDPFEEAPEPEKPISTPSSASWKGKEATTKPAAGLRCSLEQARLHRICNPSGGAWSMAKLRWMNRLFDTPAAELMERQARLGRDIRELEAMVQNPPAGWTGEKWLAMEERLAGWKGQLSAIEWVGAQRRKKPKESASSAASASASTKEPDSSALAGTCSSARWNPGT